MYKAPGYEDEWEAQALERTFFEPLDSEAALSLQMLLAGNCALDSKRRTAWAAFLLSLMHRTPEHLTETKAKLHELMEESVPRIQAKYEALRGPDDPLLYEDWERARDPHVAEKTALRLLPGIILNDRLGTFLININWAVLDVSASDHSLLLSDNPIIFRPLKLDGGHMGLAISPTKLFVAAQNSNFLKHLAKESPRQLVRLANKVVVGNAAAFVASTDRKQLPFIGKHIGTDRFGSLATGFRLAKQA